MEFPELFLSFFKATFVSCSDSRLHHSIHISNGESLLRGREREREGERERQPERQRVRARATFVLDIFYKFYTCIVAGIFGIFIGFM